VSFLGVVVVDDRLPAQVTESERSEVAPPKGERQPPSPLVPPVPSERLKTTRRLKRKEAGFIRRDDDDLMLLYLRGFAPAS
jgi:hypothetical protein